MVYERHAERRGLALASLILGLFGAPSMLADPAFGLVFGTAALLAGYVALRRARPGGVARRLAIAGVGLGIVTVLAFAVIAVLIS
ncbi:MAG: hypothetical protein HY240_03150 [Actinobacteria bacterium]|nr:hypothetical protein [Actinomycetota bacterium]